MKFACITIAPLLLRLNSKNSFPFGKRDLSNLYIGYANDTLDHIAVLNRSLHVTVLNWSFDRKDSHSKLKAFFRCLTLQGICGIKGLYTCVDLEKYRLLNRKIILKK